MKPLLKRPGRHRFIQSGKTEYGQNYFFAMILLDGPKTEEEIVSELHNFARSMGFFDIHLKTGHKKEELHENLHNNLREMKNRAWITEENGCYALTPLGRKEGEKAKKESAAAIERFIHPETASMVTLVVHFILAAVKLPAGIISGSIGLLNDAIDTLLDGLSSIFVFLGIRYNKERLANFILIAFMLGTGGLAFFEAVRRLFVQTSLSVDWLAFTASLVSGFVCFFLGLYQRFIGYRYKSLAIITQSIDSRNHCIVTLGVVAGLIAVLLRFPLLDAMVGIAIAVLILKSGIELLIEVIRSAQEDELELSRFRTGIFKLYDNFRKKNLSRWIVYLISSGTVGSRKELDNYLREELDFSKIQSLETVGFHKPTDTMDLVQKTIAELYEKNLIQGDDQLELTSKGEEMISKDRFLRGTVPRPD